MEEQVPRMMAIAEAPTEWKATGGSIKALGSATIKCVKEASKKLTGVAIVEGGRPTNYH